jgi:hypothetical protein
MNRSYTIFLKIQDGKNVYSILDMSSNDYIKLMKYMIIIEIQKLNYYEKMINEDYE